MGGVRRLVLAIAILGVVAGAAAASTWTVSTAEGDGSAGFTATRASLLLRGDEITESLSLSADHLRVERVDDWREVVRSPDPRGGSNELVGNSYRNRTETVYQDQTLLTDLKFGSDEAVLLVRPLGARTSTSIYHNGSYSLERINEHLLERSHFVSPNATEHPYDYSYSVADTLGLHLDGRGRLVVSGRFSVYLWDVDTTATSRTRTDRYRTGFHQQDSSSGTGTYVENHYVHAIAWAYNATLTVEADLPSQADVYADRIRADPVGQMRFSNASGIVPTADGPIRSTGSTLTAEGGAYAWQVGDGTIAASASEPPTAVQGGERLPRTKGAVDLRSILLLLVVTGTTALALVPDIYGRWRARIHRQRPGPDRGPPPQTWRQWRAAGLRALAIHAEGHRWVGLAAWLLGRAVRWDPDNPEMREGYAVLLREAGRYEKALDAHRKAHDQYRQGSAPEVGANAYQAARTAARAGRIREARHWFRIALRRDQAFIAMAEDEPDFGPLLGEETSLATEQNTD